MNTFYEFNIQFRGIFIYNNSLPIITLKKLNKFEKANTIELL